MAPSEGAGRASPRRGSCPQLGHSFPCGSCSFRRRFNLSKWLERLFGDAHTYLVPCTERHDALYVVGALDEAMELRGMRYHPIDIETSVIRAHKSVTEW